MVSMSVFTHTIYYTSLIWSVVCLISFVCVCAYEHNGTHLERPDAQVWCKEPVKPGNTTLTDVW